jgi:hypothetical protein
MEHLLGVAHLQELAGAHDGDERGDLRDHGQAVGDDSARLHKAENPEKNVSICTAVCELGPD